MPVSWKKSDGRASKGKIRVIDDAVHRVKEERLEKELIEAAIAWQEAQVGSDSTRAMERLFRKTIALKAWRATKGTPKNIKIPKKNPAFHRGENPLKAGSTEFPSS